MSPLISVCTAAYNAEDTIGRSIASSLAQDWPNLEIVVVDDCSSDKTWSVILDYNRKDSRIRAFRQDMNTGVAAARNRLVMEARGEFICFLDDDDWSDPTRLTSQFERLSAYESSSRASAFCYCGRYVASAGSQFVAPDPIGSRAPEPHGEAVLDAIFGIPSANALLAKGPMGCGTMMARRTSLIAAGLFDEQFRRAEEMDLAVRAALKGIHFISVATPLIVQNKTPGEEKSGRKPLDFEILLRSKYKEYLSSRRLFRASLMFANAKFWGNQGDKLRGQVYRVLGYALAPQLIPGYLKRRYGGVA